MTARQAAEHILDGILKLVADKRKSAIEMRRSGCFRLADEEQISADALSDMAAGLLSAIEEGEYGK